MTTIPQIEFKIDRSDKMLHISEPIAEIEGKNGNYRTRYTFNVIYFGKKVVTNSGTYYPAGEIVCYSDTSESWIYTEKSEHRCDSYQTAFKMVKELLAAI